MQKEKAIKTLASSLPKTKTTRTMQALSLVTLLTFLLLLSACGGGSDGGGGDTSTPNTISGNDPLFAYQWYLESSNAQSLFGINLEDNMDINISTTVSENGINGEGVVVAIVDAALQIGHEDLAPNIVAEGSHNFMENALNTRDPSPPIDIFQGGDHGTSVAGLIAARGWNNIGIRGVAPRASLVGFNLLASLLYEGLTTTQENFILALGGGSFAQNVDIFNLSFGYQAPYIETHNEDFDNLVSSIAPALRNGKGAIYVKAAGNEGATPVLNEQGIDICLGALTRNLPCDNNSLDFVNTYPNVIVVTGLNHTNILQTDSTVGSASWISAPGGNSVFNREDATEIEEESAYLLTTAIENCEFGYQIEENRPTPFDSGFSNLNPNCNYTSTFSGTSGATPLVSGTIALMLEANPNLTWRDVKRILAITAQHVDPEFDAIRIEVGGESFVAEPGWTTNAAGVHFHNYYGFGKVDVTAAVNAALTYQTELGEFRTLESDTIDVNVEIPDDSIMGASSIFRVQTDLIIEAIRISITADHNNSADLAFSLTSPNGTTSFLLPPYHPFMAELNDRRFASNAFFEESSIGEWTLKAYDIGNRGGENTGSLTSWSLTIYGRSTSE